MGDPPSTLQKRRLFSLVMVIFSDYSKKRCVIFDQIIPMAAEFLYLVTSAECAEPINLPTAVISFLIFSHSYPP